MKLLDRWLMFALLCAAVALTTASCHERPLAGRGHTYTGQVERSPEPVRASPVASADPEPFWYINGWHCADPCID